MNDYIEGIFSENTGDDLAEENHHESAFFDFVDDEVVVEEIMLELNSGATEKAEGTQPLVLEDDLDPSTASALQESAVVQAMNTLFVVSFSFRYSRSVF